MSKIVAIITEYNPFHNGHKYQIDKIREEIPNAIIFSVMSGNIVQRGEFALVDKYTRAEMALKCGVDAVFELPFPYSCATAEIFANAGVEIASKLGADFLYFGIENDSLDQIEKVANALDSDEFEKKIYAGLKDKSLSYPAKRERALAQLGIKLSRYPNDMLAVEYIRAIKNKGLTLDYRAIKRVGSSYKDSSICDIMSASAIRNHFYRSGELLSLPPKAKETITKEISEGRINDLEQANSFILATTLLSSPHMLECVFDVPKGMGHFLYKCAKNCENPQNFINELSSKSYTNSRLKRALMYNAFGITEIDKAPGYTVLLGVNENGKKIIRKTRKENFHIITKHKDSKGLSEKERILYEKGLNVDEIFATLCKKPYSPSRAYKRTPYTV